MTAETHYHNRVLPYLSDGDLALYVGDCADVLAQLPAESVHCCVTSPPYWNLRDYGADGQIGREATPQEYVANLMRVFEQVHRVLRYDGTLWLNLGDTYLGSGKGASGAGDKQLSNHGANIESGHGRTVPGLPPKSLAGVPWRVAFALQDAGWILRSEIIWKKNAMPESVQDRPTKTHETIFLLAKSDRYFYDAEAIREPAEWSRWGDQTNHKHEGSESAASWIKPATKAALQERGRRQNTDRGDGGGGGFYTASYNTGWRNARSVWEIPTESYTGSHFAVFPKELPRRCIKAGCPEGGVVLDPFAGSGTTGFVARELGRRSVLIELSEEYAKLIAERTKQLSLLG